VASDAQTLGQYFLGLSGEARRFFGPHPLDQATADLLCAQIDYTDTIRMLATAGTGAEGAAEQVVAYFILQLGVTGDERDRYHGVGISLDPQTDCTVAPSVADAFQSQDVGSLLMAHLIQIARRLGRKRMVLLGGTQAANHRAIHFYHKHGFRTIGTFEWPAGCNNYDMLLEL
jgi:GNAT superfamily N-acetyltransferase